MLQSASEPDRQQICIFRAIAGVAVVVAIPASGQHNIAKPAPATQCGRRANRLYKPYNRPVEPPSGRAGLPRREWHANCFIRITTCEAVSPPMLGLQSFI